MVPRIDISYSQACPRGVKPLAWSQHLRLSKTARSSLIITVLARLAALLAPT
ncbi:hypothetical protein ABIB34_004221 [Rhodococcus sp. UYP5]